MEVVNRFFVDTSRQYSRQSFHNRAKIRTPDGVQWITVPVKGHQFGLSIAEIQIDYASPWQVKHKKALQFNYGSTPFFEHYRDELFSVVDTQFDSLGALSVTTTRLVHGYLQSTSVLEDSETITDEAIALSSVEFSFDCPVYYQTFDGFEAGLSVLDLLFNHGPESSRIIRSGISCNPKK